MHTRRLDGRARRDRFEHRDVRIAGQHVEAHVEFVDPVMDRFELGRLVDDVYRRRDLAAVVQHAGKLQFMAITLGHMKRCERTSVGAIRGLGEHHREFGHPAAVAARVRALLVDRTVDQVDQRLEQAVQAVNQLLLVEGDRGERAQRLDVALIVFGEFDDPSVGAARVDELKDTDHLILMIDHGDGQKRLRAIAVKPIEFARTLEVERAPFVRIGHAH